MKRIFLLICLILPITAFAQDAKLQNTPADKPVNTPEKPKPVILDKARLMELENLNLKLQNLQLTLELQEKAIIKSKNEAKAADEALTNFWAVLGVKRDELATKWEARPGVDNAIILTPVVKNEAKKN